MSETLVYLIDNPCKSCHYTTTAHLHRRLDGLMRWRKHLPWHYSVSIHLLNGKHSTTSSNRGCELKKTIYPFLLNISQNYPNIIAGQIFDTRSEMNGKTLASGKWQPNARLTCKVCPASLFLSFAIDHYYYLLGQY